MSDRELLELAAKAAGYEIAFVESWNCCKHVNPVPDQNGGIRVPWIPFTDDGDALRLATRLNIDIMFFNGFQEVICGGQGDNDDNITEPYGEDIQAAVRRCIVRAAAEIGRAMP